MLDLIILGTSVLIFLLFFYILMGRPTQPQKPSERKEVESGSSSSQKKTKKNRSKGKGIVYFDDLAEDGEEAEEGAGGLTTSNSKGGPQVVSFKSTGIKKQSRQAVATKGPDDDQVQSDLRKGFVTVQKKSPAALSAEEIEEKKRKAAERYGQPEEKKSTKRAWEEESKKHEDIMKRISQQIAECRAERDSERANKQGNKDTDKDKDKEAKDKDADKKVEEKKEEKPTRQNDNDRIAKYIQEQRDEKKKRADRRKREVPTIRETSTPVSTKEGSGWSAPTSDERVEATDDTDFPSLQN